MVLRNIPVLLDGYKLMVSEEPQMKTRENDKTGESEVVTDWNGAPQYVVALFAKPLPVDGRPGGKGAEIKVTLETEPGEEISDGARVELVNPRVSHWENELGGRMMSGLSWKATGIKLAG
ncbi:hypothetical protein ABT332_19165 [Saccharomonospora azurea]|uniref:hypothetical protein n=1 Tax=Saccharomonospora azurea TaxID=40988 RepID=UPI00332B3E1C